MKEMEVGDAQSGQRLDAALSALDSSLSRSAWQSLIDGSSVKINGRIVTRPSQAVREGDKVTADMPKLPAEKPSVDIIYQDDDVLVFDKPAGILTHAKGNLLEEWTLAEIARPMVEDDGGNRPGVVHRLDRGTSGVIIMARRNEAKDFLQKQFADRRVSKTYLALVNGQVKEEEFIIDLPLARDANNPKRFTINPNGKNAVTNVKTLKSNAKHSLVELKPKTGRTHQLRVHLDAAGHAIIGDDIYSGRSQDGKRMYLHAAKLNLELPSGQRAEFEAPLPNDFQKGLEEYGLA